MAIREKIRTYYSGMDGTHHRYRSWEHCFRYFQHSKREAIAADCDHAALQLGFYLASWGMYRGSSFLLQHGYTVHLEVIKRLVAPRFSVLWEQEFGALDDDSALVPIIQAAIETVRASYEPFGNATDTLVTKVILGTFGNLPACDRYFIDGFKSVGLNYSRLNSKFVGRIHCFCRENLRELREEQTEIERAGGIRYPLMKLLDMYFWQSGFERGARSNEAGAGAAPAG
jgi:hypothetical protein